MENLSAAKLPFHHESIQVCLFGSGPAPEIVGLVTFLQANFPNVKALTIHAFDIAEVTWSMSREITKTAIVPYLWQGEFTLHSTILDLCQKDAFRSVQGILASSHLFLFQNCLNELHNAAMAIENIKDLLKQMPTQSGLIIADLASYKIVSDTKLEVESHIKDLNSYAEESSSQPTFLLLGSEAERIDFRTELRLPQIVLQELLTGTPKHKDSDENRLLTPRSRVKYNFLSAYKLFTEEVCPPLSDHNLLPQSELQELRELITQLQAKIEQKIPEKDESLQDEIAQLKLQSRKTDTKISQVDSSLQNWVRNQQSTLGQKIRQIQIAIAAIALLGGLGVVLATIALLK